MAKSKILKYYSNKKVLVGDVIVANAEEYAFL